MRDYGKISPAFWIGRTGRQLRGDADAQRVAFYLLTGPHSSMLGVFYCPVMYIANEVGMPFEGATKGLRRLQEVGFCTFDEDTETVFVLEMAKHQVGEALKEKDNRVIGIIKEFQKMPNGLIKQAFYERYREDFYLPEYMFLPSSSKAPLKPLRSQEQEQEKEQEKEQDSLSPIHGGGDLSERGARGVSEADWDEAAPFGRQGVVQDDDGDDRYPDMDAVPEPEEPESLDRPEPAPPVPRTRHKASQKQVWPADAWDRFWEQYPEKVGKKAASISFDRIRNAGLVPFDRVMAGLHRYMTTKPQTRAWCHPATWLNGARWDDQPDLTPQIPTTGNRRNGRADALNAAFDALYEDADREENSHLEQRLGGVQRGFGRDPARDRDEQLL